MASEGADPNELTEGTHEPRECMACRGTGRVISNLGGSPSTVDCPWCSGSGLRPAEIDAQAHWGTAGDGGESGVSGAPAGGGGEQAEPDAAAGAESESGSADGPSADG